jgi:hypothetical protein
VVQKGPLFAKLSILGSFLETIHDGFPFAAAGRKVKICTKAGLEVEALRYLGNHEELATGLPDMKILHPNFLYAFNNIGPGVVVVLLILTLQIRVVLEKSCVSETRHAVFNVRKFPGFQDGGLLE